MNKERILELADVIEKQPHTTRHSEGGFNMSCYTHECGTPSCIAGWATSHWGIDAPSSGMADAAAELLGISKEAADDLFLMPAFSMHEMNRIKPSQAARTLRHLAENGEVDWSAS